MANWKYGKTQYGFLVTATSASTLTLVAGSKQIQIFTGTSAHTMKLPDATTTSNGKGISFTVINQSTSAITVQDNGSNLIATVAASSSADFLLTDVSTANGIWRVGAFASSGGGGEGYAGIIQKSASYTIVSGDKGYVIDVDSSGGSINITLPAPASGFVITVKDYTGSASVNSIAVLPNASELIDQAGSDTISENYRAVTYISDGINWLRMSCFSGSVNNGPSPILGYGRGIFAGGNTGSPSNVMDYVNLAVAANAISFGTLTVARGELAGSCSSITRGIWSGGDTGSPSNVIDYVTIASTGNATTFGTISTAKLGIMCCSNSTRGILTGGNNAGNFNTIEYITIATTGNPTTFGTLASGVRSVGAACSSTTRGVFANGDNGTQSTVIDYVVIATTGNSTTFGTSTSGRYRPAGCSSSTRGIFGGGSGPSSIMDYITIATTGNATSFGSLSVARSGPGACSTPIRGVWSGGTTGSNSSVMDYVTIATTANAVSFGSLSVARQTLGGCSNSHGGL